MPFLLPNQQCQSTEGKTSMQQSAKYKAERTVGNGISQSEHARCGGNTAGSYTVQLDKLPSIKEMTTKVRPTSLPSLLTASPDSYAYEL